MAHFENRAVTASAKSTHSDKEVLLDLPSGKYGQVPEPSAVLLRRAELPPNPVLPKQTITRATPKTMRERVPLSSSLTGAGRAGKPGCLSSSLGKMYVGQVLAGQPHGRGDYFMPGVQFGSSVRPVYSGDFVKGAKTGHGTAYYSNGEEYTGAWVDNKRTGYGRLTYLDGCVYEGMWQEDERHGVGMYYSTNGDIYVGMYVNDKRHGLGTTYMPRRGKKYVAEYVCGSAQCGVFHDLAADGVEPPPTQRLRDTINSTTLQQAVKGHLPAQMPLMWLSQPSKVLAKEVAAVRKQRSQQKAPVDGTLGAEIISLLRHAFILIAGGDDVSCFILPHQLQELVVMAGLDPAAPPVVRLVRLLQDKMAATNSTSHCLLSSGTTTSASTGIAVPGGQLLLEDLMQVVCLFRESPLCVSEQNQLQLAQAHHAAPAAALVAVAAEPATAHKPVTLEADVATADADAVAGPEDQQWEPEGAEPSATAIEHDETVQEAGDDWGAAADEQMLEVHTAQHRGGAAGLTHALKRPTSQSSNTS